VSRINYSDCVTICPIGFVEEDILTCIAHCIDTQCGTGCIIADTAQCPYHAYNRERDQYNSKLILPYLLKCCPHEALRIIGVTYLDLYVPIFKYIFGLAQMGGKCSVISLFRLRPQFYDLPPDPGLFMSRVKKTALHELGHCFGLTHCRDRRCVMYSSSLIKDTDRKGFAFCPTCRDLFQWHLKTSSL